SVIPGSRIGDRLGSQVAISSHPIVVNPRQGGVQEALRTFVREAPRTIERTTAGSGSERLAPVLSRERTLPPDTAAALRERAVVADRGRLSGPAAGELAPRGAIVERSRESLAVDRRGLTVERRTAPDSIVRERETVAPRATVGDGWRGRAGAETVSPPPAARA